MFTRRASFLVAVAIIIFAGITFMVFQNDESTYELMNQKYKEVIMMVNSADFTELENLCRNDPQKFMVVYSMTNQFTALEREDLKNQMNAIDKLREASCPELLNFK
jgi:hypothetical protein